MPRTSYVNPRCPSCSSFISLQPYIDLRSDWVMCRACGLNIHVPTVFDVQESSPQPVAHGVAFQNRPKVNAQSKALSNLRPDGKISQKRLKESDLNQLGLFGGVL